MAEALISIVLERLSSVAEQQIRDGVNLVVGVDEEIQSLKHTFRSLRDVVDGAECRLVKDEAVRDWLGKLKDIAYQMDDVVDEWSTALLRLQIEGPEINASTSKKEVSCCVPSPFFCVKQVASRPDIAVKIQSIKQQLDAIHREGEMFNFAKTRTEKPLHFVTTTSRIDFSEVYGREEDEKTIVSHLLGETGDQKPGLYIFAIVGMGGIGKTALARLSYNHPEVEAHFDARIWVSVSDYFQPSKIFKLIVETFKKMRCRLDSFKVLEQEVETCISGRKFLLVLDDLWNEDRSLWEPFMNTLTCGAAGSRILVTTRSSHVTWMMGSRYYHLLRGLSWEQSRALFHRIAFSEKSREKEEELKETIEKIADKCEGWPLAIKTLGNLMRLKINTEEWVAVLNHEVWSWDAEIRTIPPALLISYYALPPEIKRCFLFCGVFLHDEVIERDQLIKLWMAHNYLKCDGSKEIEMVGREYFEYLAYMSLFQDFEKDDDGNITCKMHDLFRDLARSFMENECVDIWNDNQKERSMENARHATLIVVQKDVEYMTFYTSMKNLHTLFVFYSEFSKPITPLFQHLTCLRALSLGDRSHFKKLPKEVGKLIHLRYLDLSGCVELRELPDTICNLYNLQTLNIRQCHSLEKLPHAMGKLINLRHLENFGTTSLKSLPKGIGRLNSLQTLERFVISSDGDDKCKLGDLRNLNQVGGTLTITGLDKVKHASQAEEGELEKKIRLRVLILAFPIKGLKDVAEALKPPAELKSLSISTYGDVELPSWMRSSLTHLKRLELFSFMECYCMPPLGELPLLENLHIKDMVRVKYMGDDLLGSSSTIAFPRLKVLKFTEMKKWEKWEVKEKEERLVMPYLSVLTMNICPKLEGLPDKVLKRATLQKLEIIDCPLLKQQYEEDGRISRIPNTEFR